MATLTYKSNQAALNRMLRGRPGPVQLHVANVGRQVEGAARKLVPVVSGNLQRSIGSRLTKSPSGEWMAVVFADSPYATWIEDGKRFDPRSGGTIFVKVGPRPFLKQALASVGLRLSRRAV